MCVISKIITHFLFLLLRYVAGDKGLLQPHDLLDHVEKIIQEDEGMHKLKEGPFFKELESAQVNSIYLSYSFDKLQIMLEFSLGFLVLADFTKLLFLLSQEAIVLPPFVSIALCPRPGVWDYFRINAFELSVDSLNVAEYLRFKEELVDGE